MSEILLLFLTLLITFISIFPWYVGIRNGNFDIAEPINFASIFMMIVSYSFIYRIYITERSYNYYPELINSSFEEGFILALGLYIIYFFCVLLGYYGNLPLKNYLPTFPDETQENVALLGYIALIYIFLGLMFYYILILAAFDGNPLRMFTTAEPRSRLFEGAYQWRLGAQMIHIGYFLWVVQRIANGRSPSFLQLALFVPVFLMFAIFGDRGGALGMVVTLIIILYYIWFKQLMPVDRNFFQFKQDLLHDRLKLVSVPIIGSFLVFSSVFMLRLRQGRSPLEALQEVEIARVIAMREGHIERLILFLEVSQEEIGYYYGTYRLRPILNFIPRSIWENKPPLSIGTELRRVARPDGSGGISPSVLAEHYVDFGYVGIILGGLATGLLLRYLYLLLNKNNESVLCLYIYSYVLLGLARGGLTNNTLFVILSEVFLLILPVIVVIHLYNKGKNFD